MLAVEGLTTQNVTSHRRSCLPSCCERPAIWEMPVRKKTIPSSTVPGVGGGRAWGGGGGVEGVGGGGGVDCIHCESI